MTPGLSTAILDIYVDNTDDPRIVHSITGYIYRQPKMTPGLSTALLDIYVDNRR